MAVKTVSKRVPGWTNGQKPFPPWFLEGGVAKNCFQKGFWMDGLSKTVSKRVFEGRSGRKPFPKGFLVGGAVKNRFQKGF